MSPKVDILPYILNQKVMLCVVANSSDLVISVVWFPLNANRFTHSGGPI